MKTFALSVALLGMAIFSRAQADEGVPATRHVVGGDLVYRASSIAPIEARAVFLAQARAAWMLGVECGAPPRDTRVYSQATQRTPEGFFATAVELGAPIADCESVRRAASADRERMSQPDLVRLVALYEADIAGTRVNRSPNAVVTTHAQVEPLPMVLWTADQEISHIRAIEARVDRRMAERALFQFSLKSVE